MEQSGLKIDISNRNNWVGIIGTRNPTTFELMATEQLVQNMINNGAIIVSGLAKGIDAKAHDSAIKYNGLTIAIVNTTINEEIYPKENRELAERIRRNGCILHPFITPSEKNDWSKKGLNQFQRRLIERDIILAKMCNTIIAVSDNEIITGGTRWAVNYGIKLGKKVGRMRSDGAILYTVKAEPCYLNYKMEFDITTI